MYALKWVYFSQENTLIDYVKYLKFYSNPSNIFLRNGLICMLMTLSSCFSALWKCCYLHTQFNHFSVMVCNGPFNGPSNLLLLFSPATALTSHCFKNLYIDKAFYLIGHSGSLSIKLFLRFRLSLKVGLCFQDFLLILMVKATYLFVFVPKKQQTVS